MSLEHPFASLTNASLTKPQRKILDAIHFFLRKGEVPTVREVGALVGLRSPATVLKHLRALYAAEVSLVDRWIGRLLDRMRIWLAGGHPSTQRLKWSGVLGGDDVAF